MAVVMRNWWAGVNETVAAAECHPDVRVVGPACIGLKKGKRL